MHDLYARYCLEVNIKLPSSFAILGSPVCIVSLHPPKVLLSCTLVGKNACSCQFCSLRIQQSLRALHRWGRFAKETSASQRQKFDTDYVKSVRNLVRSTD